MGPKLPLLVVASLAAPISGTTSSFSEFYHGPSFYEPSYSMLIPSLFPTSESRIDFSSSSSSYSSSSSSSQVEVEKDYFYMDRCGPFSLSNPSNPNVTFTYSLYGISSQNIIERVRLFKESNVVSANTKAAFYYEKGTRKSVTFNLPISDYWSSKGLTIKFELINSSTYAILKTFSASFNPPLESFVHSNLLKNSLYTSDSVAFYGDGETMKECPETFDFTTFGDYLGVDNYYRLNIANNKFNYPNDDIVLSYKTVNLLFNDSECLFPNMSHTSNGDINIPLILQRVGNTVNFRFKNTFYINKRSLDMSDTYKEGYVVTRDFYLPINGRKKFNGKNLYIEIKELGLNKISTTFGLKYQTSRSMVGLSTDGDYYIVGGNKK